MNIPPLKLALRVNLRQHFHNIRVTLTALIRRKSVIFLEDEILESTIKRQTFQGRREDKFISTNLTDEVRRCFGVSPLN